MKIAVTSPIYVSNPIGKKYLDLTTMSIRSEKNDIIWIPCENYVQPDCAPLVYNFSQPISDIRTLHPEGQQSVSKAWNMGIDEGIKVGADYILAINHDIILKPNAIDCLVDFAVDHQEAVLWSAKECRDLVKLIENCAKNEEFTKCPSFACFMVKADFFEHVGRFDENFTPAYYEDNDMHARLVLAGKETYTYNGALFFHFISQTIRNDENLFQRNLITYQANERYFVEKWGHSPVNDFKLMKKTYYKHPYNDQYKLLSYWRNPTLHGTISLENRN